MVLRCLLTSPSTVLVVFFFSLNPLHHPHQHILPNLTSHLFVQSFDSNIWTCHLTKSQKIAVFFAVILATVYVWFAGVFIYHKYLDIPTKPKSKLAIIRTDWEDSPTITHFVQGCCIAKVSLLTLDSLVIQTEYESQELLEARWRELSMLLSKRRRIYAVYAAQLSTQSP
jgi:hypothetical protein